MISSNCSPNSNISNTLVDSLPKGTTVESIVCLSRKDTHERIGLDGNADEPMGAQEPQLEFGVNTTDGNKEVIGKSVARNAV